MLTYYIFGILVFLACVVAFSVGFKFGHAVREDKQPKLEPIKAVTETVQKVVDKAEAKKEENSLDDALRSMLMYDGDPQAKGTGVKV
jgi:hypothetical protein